MIVVNGVSGSGFEAVLASFKKSSGPRHVANRAYENRQALKASEHKAAADYEKYLDKFDKDDQTALITDVTDLAPEGIWPIYNFNPEAVRAATGAAINSDAVMRIGGSLFDMDAAEVTKIYVVLASPETVWLRRSNLKFRQRKLDAKYATSKAYREAVSLEFREWNIQAKSMAEEFTMLKNYINNCLCKFGDKLTFINGDADPILFEHDGKTVRLSYSHAEKRKDLHATMTDERLVKPFSANPAYDEVRRIWAEIQELITTKNFIPMMTHTALPLSWFCARLQSQVNSPTCVRCVASQGESVIENAKPGWDLEPCAYEVAYGPEPHKTIEQSVNEHSWGVLP